jgi:hypothetical protein
MANKKTIKKTTRKKKTAKKMKKIDYLGLAEEIDSLVEKGIHFSEGAAPIRAFNQIVKREKLKGVQQSLLWDFYRNYMEHLYC